MEGGMVLRINLEGKKIGKLQVLNYQGNKKYLCKCDCGQERVIFSNSLRNGKSHCGCEGLKLKDRFKDLQGMKFGLLTVVSKNNEIKRKRAYWNCFCHCGKSDVVRGSHLISGQIKSCGCVNEIDLSGKFYGRLNVLSDTGKRTARGRQKIWLCLCECGQEKKVSTSNLNQGYSTHCGCKNTERINDFNIARLNSLYNNIKGQAKVRKIDFYLNIDDIQKNCSSNCFYCNSPPENKKMMHALKGEKEKRQIIYQGIDRKDNSLGYISENIRPCCNLCNKMKGSLELSEWLNHIKKIKENLCEVL